MKPNNAMKTCGFRASATNEKLKHEAPTQAANGMQAMSMSSMTQLNAILQYY